MSRRSKFLTVCTVAFILFCATVFGLSQLLSNRVNAFVLNLAEKMTREIGHPVQLDSVTTKWDWMLLKVNIKNLKILEKEGSFPLFMASEIVSTVDTLDSIRSFSLKFKQLLLRSPRLVVQWDGTEAPAVLGLGHENVSDEVSPEALFKILSMQRRIVVENGDLHLQGKNGEDLPFMDVKIDFKQHGEQEYTMVAHGNIAAAVQPEFVISIKYFGELSNYEKAMLEFEIRTSNVQMAELFNFIPKYRQSLVHGNFADFDLKGIVQNGTVRSVTSDFSITNISIDRDTQIKGGTGHIDYKPGENKSSIQLAHLTLHNDKLYTQPLNIDAVSSDLIYEELPDGPVHILAENANIKLLETEIKPTLKISLDDNAISDLQLSANLEDASVRRLMIFLPDKLFPLPLTEWLKKSIVAGDIDHFKVSYNPKNLQWSLGFKNAELKFAHDWPSVHDIDATLIMDNGKLAIKSSRAKILGNDLRSLNTYFTPIADKQYARLTVDGNMDTTLETALNYIQQTPLQEKFGAKIEPFNPTGKMGLSLQLNFDLAHKDVPVVVNGAIDLQNVQLQAVDLNVPMQEINGVLAFSNNSFSGKNIKLNIFDQPATANVSMVGSKNNTLNIAINTPLRIASLKALIPALKLEYLEGVTNVNATIQLPWGEDKQGKTLNITSDLVGVAMNYPAPFNKTAQTKMPLQVQYHINSKNEDIVKFKFALLDGILFLKNRNLYGGRIAIGNKLDSVAGTDGIFINGNLQKLDWSQWSPFIRSSQQNDALPIEIDLRVASLLLNGDEYKPVHIKYNTARSELFIDTQILTGTFAFNQEADVLAVRLDRLNMPENRVKNTALMDYLRDKRAAGQLPLVQIFCDQMQINKRTFKKISLELLPRTYGYEIVNFSINNDHLVLQAQGSWQMDGNVLTSLSGNIYTQNFGKVLGEWGYNNSISRGKGELNFNVHWDGAPMDFDVLKIAGSSRLDLRSGSLTSVNPGIGRIIGLLSLESIQRRLQLDFSDLLSKGFAFDKFVADIKFEPGSVLSDNVLITSPAAKIELSGKTGIKSQDLDFTMFVTPKVGASLPIAAAIAAGNPAIGAAIWLFDKASGSKISEITKYKYKVTGTWDAPKVDEVGKNDGAKVAEYGR